MAHVEKRGPNKYRVRYRAPDGREKSKTFAKKAYAERFMHTVEESKLRGAWVDPALGKIRFGEWADKWFETRTDLRPSTRARDESYLNNHVLPHWRDFKIGDITSSDVRDWVALLKKNHKPATVRLIFAMFSKPMKEAEHDRKIPVSPSRNIALPRIERVEMRFLTALEVEKLASAVDPQYRALVYLGAYGGLRRGELLALRCRRVDIAQGFVDVVENLTEVDGHLAFGSPKTRAGQRRVPLPRAVMAELEAHMEVSGRDGNDLVFQSPKGGPVRATLWRARFWVPAIERAGLDGLRIHDLRHTAVSFWIAAGMNAKRVASLAGHTSTVVVFDRYGHLCPDSDDIARARLDEQFRTAVDKANRENNRYDAAVHPFPAA